MADVVQVFKSESDLVLSSFVLLPTAIILVVTIYISTLDVLRLTLQKRVDMDSI